VQPWQTATAVFLAYVAAVAVLPRGLPTARRTTALAGAGAGALGLVASVALPFEGFANTWILPGLLLLIGYWTSGALFVAPMPRLERVLVDLDVRLHVQGAAGHFPRALVELLELAYAGIYPLILVALGIAMRHGIPAGRFWTVILVTDYICFGMLPWFQTRPPRALGFDTPWQSSWRAVNLKILDGGSVQVNTFPSGHAAEALAAALLCLGAPAPVVGWMFFNAAAISAGAVFGRYHYAADAFAGWLVALVVYLVL
jgi:hypothetical protein